MASCAECGKAFRRRAYNGQFCGGTCRRVFNNRRAVRGAILYDLAMIETHNPEHAAKHSFAARREALIAAWIADDKGRRTYQSAGLVTEATNYLTYETKG